MKKNEKILDMIGQADEKYIPEIKKMQDNKKEKNAINEINKEGSEEKTASVIVVKNSKRNNFIKWFAVCGGICASLVLMIHLGNNKPSDINNDSPVASISTVTTVTEPVISQTETKVSETSTTEISRGTYIRFLSMDGEVTDSVLLENAAPADWGYFYNQACFTDEKLYYFMRQPYNAFDGGWIFEVDRKTNEYTMVEDEQINKNKFIKLTLDKEETPYYFYGKHLFDENEVFHENAYVSEINSELQLVNEISINEIFGLEELNLCDVVFDEDNIMYCLYEINDDLYIGKAKLTSGEFMGSQFITGSEYYNLTDSIIDIDSSGNIITGLVSSTTDVFVSVYDADTLNELVHNEINGDLCTGFTYGAGEYDIILIDGCTFMGYDAKTDTINELFTKEGVVRAGFIDVVMVYHDQLMICEKYYKEE